MNTTRMVMSDDVSNQIAMVQILLLPHSNSVILGKNKLYTSQFPHEKINKFSQHHFFFFFLMATPAAYGISPGQGLNPSNSCNLRYSCSNAGSSNAGSLSQGSNLQIHSNVSCCSWILFIYNDFYFFHYS